MPRRFPSRPPRLDLFQNVSPFYFLTFNTKNRKHLLASEKIHNAFLHFCQRAETEHSIAVGRYVIMPDHIHLFVFLPEDGTRLSQWVGLLKRTLGGTSAERLEWQEGFFDHVLRGEESYSLKWEYVRQNPVRAGLCQQAELWPWQGEVVRIEF